MQKIDSFTKEIKEEICSFNELTTSQEISLLSAYIRTNGSLVFKNLNDYIILESENAKVIKFIYGLLKNNFSFANIHFSYKRKMKLNKNIKFVLEVSDANTINEALGINFLESKITYRLIDKEIKIKSYLAGLFLASGSCNDPVSSNYHLEIVLKDEEFANQVIKLTNKIKNINFNFKLIKRRNSYVVYLKKSDLISDFLAFIEANASCIKFENVRVDRDFSNVTNRLLN